MHTGDDGGLTAGSRGTALAFHELGNTTSVQPMFEPLCTPTMTDNTPQDDSTELRIGRG